MSGPTCKSCGKQNCSMLAQDDCWQCHEPKRRAWREKVNARQDPTQFDVRKVVNLLLLHVWQHECVIVPDYMPPLPRADTRPTCQVYWPEPNGDKTWLRHSLGPLQGYSWDVYGDDFQSPELALIALSQAPPPTRVDYCIPTHGN